MTLASSLFSVTLAALLTGTVACARAQTATPVCRVDPFGAESAADRAHSLAHTCGGERVDYQLQSHRVRPTDPGPSRLFAHVDAVASRPLWDGVLGTLRLNWSGSMSDETERLRTERTALAAGGWLQLDRALALQLSLGREFAAATRTRATVAGIWQPVRSGLMFAEWAGNNAGTEGHRVGLRWWLIANRLALDAGARYLNEVGWADQQVAITFGVLR
jgi:hypothetical protein